MWEQRLVNRFVFPGIRTHSEFIYRAGPFALCLIMSAIAVSSPFVLAIEGVKRLLPDKVIKVAP